ncbi:MAG: fibrobacter succinogenes major paralogous domain-containing protein, partial [Candidatus Marinimicrobia bacterium]|nr:fibrobacter succinogenes major paralogous domain-containing protein [Candidatus Neomarinimicrobiota bacterium]
MAENLKVTHYRNGDPIPNVTDNTDWSNLTTGAYCNYDNNGSNVTTYGRLYNWHAVSDARQIAPAGWHVPSDEEWQTLVDYLGGSGVAGGKMKETGTTHWNSPNTGATNESGFSALPGGYRYLDGGYYDMGYYAYFWSSTEGSSGSAWSRHLYYDHSEVGRYFEGKRLGFSVRCVMGENLVPDTPNDPSPSDAETDQDINLSLSWTCSDPDGDPLTYDIYFGTSSDPSLVNSNQSATSYDPGSLVFNTKYYWKIVAKDDHGRETEGPVWSFMTRQSSHETGTVTDIDGNTYQTVKIGDQWWMAENLKVTHYRNGDPIPNVTDNTDWSNLTTGAYCNYDNNASYVTTYGRLYNWYTVNDSRYIAPSGWHVPTDEELKELEMYLGMSQSQADYTGYRGTDEGGKLKETGTTHW